ncbi:MAG: hypothetical protein K0S30_392 [Clostridia bacterium]|jgi:hypothetical protein|nr:hypothetical protein [Clostridia bacterium]
MKYLLILAIILQILFYAYKSQEEYEPFYIIKCIIYLIVSSIHSVIIIIKLPLGACLMSLIYLIDKKNRSVKLRLIGSGIIIVLLSALTYKDISQPFQKLYLYHLQPDAKKIEIYTHNATDKKFLFSIENQDTIHSWINIIKKSNSYNSWNYKILPQNTGYLIKLCYPSKTTSIVISPYTSHIPNVFVGNYYIPFTNALLPDLITSQLDIKPLALHISSAATAITDMSIINDLWDEILWGEQINDSSINNEIFEIKGDLLLNKNKGISLNFSSDFTYIQLNTKEIIQLSAYLKNKLNEQYILSQLDAVDSLMPYTHSHVHTPPSHTVNYMIALDSVQKYHGLYMSNTSDNTKMLLHTVSSPESEFFLLKNPYILLLDEKFPSIYHLMLINQNIPNKHRYVEKSKNILPDSIALCPQNTKFTYTIDNGDSSTLYVVSNYYDPPLTIATGEILDSLFLSDKYLLFSLVIENTYLLCIYDTQLSKTIRYITIPGELHMIKVENNNVIFAIHHTKDGQLKEGLFALNTDLKIKKIS